jgi:hypothetical protein
MYILRVQLAAMMTLRDEFKGLLVDISLQQIFPRQKINFFRSINKCI